jgi:hypothetical protein
VEENELFRVQSQCLADCQGSGDSTLWDFSGGEIEETNHRLGCFRSDAGKEALLLMPADLKKGHYAVLDYDEKLLGRKLEVDDTRLSVRT